MIIMLFGVMHTYCHIAGSLFSSLDGIAFVINERFKPPPKVFAVCFFVNFTNY